MFLRALARARPALARAASSTPPPSPAEAALEAQLRAALPGATAVTVRDTSGGCGTMYSIDVAAAEFEGKPTVKQHQLVTAALREAVPTWHGFQLTTRVAGK